MNGILITTLLLAGSSIGYSNMEDTTHLWNFQSAPSTPEHGDLIEFSGDARRLKSVSMILGSAVSSSGSVDATLRVRKLDPVTGMPGEVIAMTTKAGIEYNRSYFAVEFSMPDVEVPDEVFVTVEFTNGTSSGYGVYHARGAEVGSSNNEEWYSSTREGTWHRMGAAGRGDGNLAIKVEMRQKQWRPGWIG